VKHDLRKYVPDVTRVLRDYSPEANQERMRKALENVDRPTPPDLAQSLGPMAPPATEEPPVTKAAQPDKPAKGTAARGRSWKLVAGFAFIALAAPTLAVLVLRATRPAPSAAATATASAAAPSATAGASSTASTAPIATAVPSATVLPNAVPVPTAEPSARPLAPKKRPSGTHAPKDEPHAPAPPPASAAPATATAAPIAPPEPPPQPKIVN
jgi:hypothetical protein